jgi:hypothetical protein
VSGKIGAEVPAAALFAPQRRPRDEPAHRQDARTPPAFVIEYGIAREGSLESRMVVAEQQTPVNEAHPIAKEPD